MHYTDKRFTFNFIRHFDVHTLLSIVRRADIELKLKGIQGYKAFLKETIEEYGLQKNDLLKMLELCKNKEVITTLKLLAKYDQGE